MILLIDNYDSFSYNLFQLIGEIEPDIKIIRNDEMTIEEIKKLNPSRIILPWPRQTGRCRNHYRGCKTLGRDILFLGFASAIRQFVRRSVRPLPMQRN